MASQSGSNILKLAEQVSEENEANGLEPSNVQGYERFGEAINQLTVGRADAVFSQDIDAAARQESQPGEFEVAYTFPDAETFAVYYSPDAPEIGEKIYEVDEGARGIRRARADRQRQRHAAGRHQRPTAGRSHRLTVRRGYQERPPRALLGTLSWGEQDSDPADP